VEEHKRETRDKQSIAIMHARLQVERLVKSAGKGAGESCRGAPPIFAKEKKSRTLQS